VFGDVVELPLVLVHGRKFAGSHEPRRGGRMRSGNPAVMVNGTVANHFEILRVALRRRIGVGRIEGVTHADAFDRLLLDAVDHVRLLDAGGFENGWNDVDDVVELGANSPHVLDVSGPGDGHALPGTPEM